MRIGILTGGGDCPGLNAVIRAVVLRAVRDYGWQVTGFRDGWRGVLEDHRVELEPAGVRGILARGGTILGSSRVNPDTLRASIDTIRSVLASNRIDALIPVGGEGTLQAAHWLSSHDIPVVGVPKTIDNDIDCTDVTFGFDTAVEIATDAIDRLHTTAESHQRVMVVEVMGRHTGWIALHSALAAGAHQVLTPETPFDLDQVCTGLRRRFDAGDNFAVLVAAEGATPAPGTMPFDEGYIDQFGHRRFAGIARVTASLPGSGLPWLTGIAGVAVMTVLTETDVLGGVRPGYHLARRPDDAHLRVWEIAGAAHADAYTINAGFVDTGLLPIDELAAGFASHVAVGDPHDPATLVGPLVAERQRTRVLGLLDRAVQDGVTVATGGGRPASQATGWYVEPTILAGVDNGMQIAQEEIFGPVLALIAYDTEDDAVRIANDSHYGLSGGVWSGDADHAVAVAKRVRTGSIAVNGVYPPFPFVPFGGFKESGLGRELGPEGLTQFLEPRSIGLPAGAKGMG